MKIVYYYFKLNLTQKYKSEQRPRNVLTNIPRPITPFYKIYSTYNMIRL